MTPHPRWRWLAAAALPIALLLPFIQKPFHMDDPLFLWLAQHIQEDPIHFFDFDVNWHQSPQPMYEVTMNPPGAGYFIAAAAALVGWTEPALHAVFLLIAAAASLGTFALARQCCAQPLLATALATLCPVFLVSSTNLMSDTLMLALYTWAIALWVQGLTWHRHPAYIPSSATPQTWHGHPAYIPSSATPQTWHRHPACSPSSATPQTWHGHPARKPQVALLYLTLAALLIAAGILVKYMTITLIPLLAAYTLATERKLTPKHLLFLIPIATVIAYHFATLHLFGRSMIVGAAAFSTDHAAGHATEGSGTGAFMRLLVTLAFTGGCAAPVLFAAAFAGRRFDRIALATAFAAALAILFIANRLDTRLVATPDGIRWSFVLQAALWIATGATLLILAAHDLYSRRDPIALLLVLWIAGIVAFTAWINWTINGRTLLPIVPAVGILLARRTDFRSLSLSRSLQHLNPPPITTPFASSSSYSSSSSKTPTALALALTLSATLALAVTHADYAQARAQKAAAHEIAANLTPADRANLIFQGHWGFHYYMQQLGTQPFDREKGFHPGDQIVIPENSPSLLPLPQELIREIAIVQHPAGRVITTMHRDTAAGFYAHFWGPLPFYFGPAPQETFRTYEITALE